MITQSMVKEIFQYDEKTGIFIWRSSKCPARFNGKVAGRKDTGGHIQIYVLGKRYMAHRLTWLYMYGEDHIHIDHINGTRDDNRITNLRPATSSQNAMNRKRPSTNTSGYKGVSFHKGTGKWQASIKINRKQKYLGVFDTPELAKEAYSIAAATLFGEYRRD